jgi:hypothetical protein
MRGQLLPHLAHLIHLTLRKCISTPTILHPLPHRRKRQNSLMEQLFVVNIKTPKYHDVEPSMEAHLVREYVLQLIFFCY